ncbi:hypothetical protein V6V47_31960 [Micromonospora sp. CPCC 205539]|uniref:hypothetical protein n=1 Tax=Micromonospora sp. CPCC 205539 TaxID=3122408 RepID=UPI002FF37D5F
MTAATDGTSEEDPGTARDDLADPLAPWARALALVLGVGATGFGCYAVMVSDNQAGTAFVLLAGAVLLLLGLQGTPLRRLGSGDHSLELAALRRRQRAIQVVADATREQPPEVAVAVAEAVEAIEPLLNLHSRAMRYELKVHEAIERLGVKVPYINLFSGPDTGFDLIAQLPSGTVRVEIKYRSRGTVGHREVVDISQRVAHLPQSGLLVVTNVLLSDSVIKYNNEAGTDPRRVEIVTWNTPDDDDDLAAALARSAR